MYIHNYFPVVSCCILYDLGTGLCKSNLSMAHTALPLLLLLTLSLLFPPQNVVCHHWDVLCCAIVPCCGTSPCFEIAPCRETVLNHSLPSSPSSPLSLRELCTHNTETVKWKLITLADVYSNYGHWSDQETKYDLSLYRSTIIPQVTL